MNNNNDDGENDNTLIMMTIDSKNLVLQSRTRFAKSPQLRKLRVVLRYTIDGNLGGKIPTILTPCLINSLKDLNVF